MRHCLGNQVACSKETDLGGCKYGPWYTGAKPLVKLPPVITWKADHVSTEPVAPGDTVGESQRDSALDLLPAFVNVLQEGDELKRDLPD